MLGLNGSGKSTLLKIMAGVDTEFDGEARPMPELNIGYLPQEPQLDPTKSVREVVEEAVSVVKDAQARLDEVYAAYADPDADFDKLAAEQAKLEAILQASDGHNLERQLEVAADALRLPAWDARIEHLSGGEKRRVALCRLLLSAPTCCCWTNRPTTWTPTPSPGWSTSSTTSRAQWWPSPTTVTSSTTSPAGSSSSTVAPAFRTRATTPVGWRPSRPAWPRNPSSSRPTRRP